MDKKEALDAEVAEAEKRVAAKEAEVAALHGAQLGREWPCGRSSAPAATGSGRCSPASSELTDDLQRDQLLRGWR